MQSHIQIHKELNYKQNECTKLKQFNRETGLVLDMNSDTNSDNTKHSLSCKTIEEVNFDLTPITDRSTDFILSDLSDNPYLSNLDLPVILEEDAEYDCCGTARQPLELICKNKSDDSPFCIFPNENQKSFEDSCEHSQLMNILWSKIQLKH